MPLDRWHQLLLRQSIPAQISYHAGTYLCNAIMYLTHHWLAERGQNIPVGFIHLPLATSQVVDHLQAWASLPVTTLAQAITCVLDDMVATHARLGSAWASPPDLA
jgi:pyroglutamyl-peptidase